MNIEEISPKGQGIYVQGTYTYFYTIGPENGFPVVLLHGFLSSSYTWRNVWTALAEKYRVYIVDLPGYGKSESLKFPCSVDSYSEFMEQFLKKMGINKSIIIGTQMGGSIAAWFASQHPNLIEKLVIIAAGAMGENRKNMWLYKLISSKIIGRIVVFFFPFNLFAQRWKAACVNINPITDEVISTYFKIFKKSGNTQTSIGLQVRKSYGSNFERFLPEMQRIDFPTLLVWGENDPLVPLSTAQRFKNSIRNSQLVIIPDCGDFPHEEYPELVSSYILNFIS